METGRELDAIVAEAIGWHWVKQREGKFVPPETWLASGNGKSYYHPTKSVHVKTWAGFYQLELPHFSTVWGAVGDVLEWLRHQRSNVTLGAANGWGCHAWDVVWDEEKGEMKDYENAVNGYGDTAMEAICRCVLEVRKRI